MMLIRELVLRPRGGDNKYWVSSNIDLADGTTLVVQQPTAAHSGYLAGSWFVLRYVASSRGDTGWWDTHEQHLEMDEFEAQAVVDHYIQTIGLKIKPSGDTQVT